MTDPIENYLKDKPNLLKYYESGKQTLTDQAMVKTGLKQTPPPPSTISTIVSNPYVWLGLGVVVVGGFIIYQRRQRGL
jgi:hypothetical protein